MKTCIILSAIPGSGKSTWAHAFQQTHPNTHIVSSDDLRLELYGSVTNFQHEDIVWKTFLERLQSFSTLGDDVYGIADATCLQNKFRLFYLQNTPGYDKHVLILFNIPYSTCLKQNKMRDNERVLPLPAMEKLKNEYEEPSEEVKKAYDEILVVKEKRTPSSVSHGIYDFVTKKEL
jgi:predicted kinase